MEYYSLQRTVTQALLFALSNNLMTQQVMSLHAPAYSKGKCGLKSLKIP